MSEEKKEVGLIFKKIPLIMAEIESIGKDRKNESQKYRFRGIDDVYNAMHDILTKHKVFTVPSVLEAKHEERQSRSGGVLIYRIYTIKYTFYAEDGSSIEAIVIGEGMDSGDKAGNKAMSVAHKYALLQVFCVPTEDPKDPENNSHEVGEKKAEPKPRTENPKDIDLAADSEKEGNEIQGIIAFVKVELKNNTIDYKNFKEYLSLIQKEFNPPKNLVGKQFGNLSLSVGRLADLRALKKNIDGYLEGYIKHEMKKANKKEAGSNAKSNS